MMASIPLKRTLAAAAACTIALIPAAATAQEIASEHVLAAAPEAFGEAIYDQSGVLSDEQITELEQRISQFLKSHQRNLKIAFVDSFDGVSGETWSTQFLKANGGGNLAVLVINTTTNQYGTDGGQSWSRSEIGSLYNAVIPALAERDYHAAASTFIDTAESSGQVSGDSVAWLGAGAVAVVGAGGGIWYLGRKRRKEEKKQVVESARRMDPTDTTSLRQLPIPALGQVADDYFVATDESIRRGEEELAVATSEFGTARTRPFRRALDKAQSALRRAYDIHDQLHDAIPETDEEKRTLLTEVITSCSAAQKELDKQAKDFADMRNLLLNADNKIAEVTQRTVDIRARLPKVTETLDNLTKRYPETTLTSVRDNPELAAASLDAAENSLSAARSLAQKPAGQQGGLVMVLREAEHAVEVADRMLSAVEHADENIATARASLESLVEEVQEEIAEAEDLRARGTANGAQADWAALDDLVAEARGLVDKAKRQGTEDPLGIYTDLNDLDARLDERLDALRETTSTQDRLVRMYRQHRDAAHTTIQAAEDLISSRGRLVGAQARTYLSEARQLLQRAESLEAQDLRQAVEAARQATQRAQVAMRAAQSDIDEHYRQQRRQDFSSGAGSLITGMVIGNILGGGGNHGGFGGGFGDGYEDGDNAFGGSF
ncbi:MULTISPECIES: TPM domain-containing protein [unclassified Corynebacterium]|uniref:TPM domain-containing protein n=1 Tax=unclassified Corynebacterium TaxID=2624378 RepID=UPI0029C9D945|nr:MULTISPECIES: TPM domain-containing protein [unclassified Corynebacterium]WPF65532.1 TPM domain-containing protein [Corynebacterium sp. 22KM0430]WPF68027.1 TPM domain-containing protein [Corynebacterium sp. 21KM1197]